MVAPVEAPYVREEQPLGEIMQDRVVDLFGMQQAAKERRQAMFRTLAATARLQSQLGKSSPMTPPKAAPKVLVDQLGKSSPTTPPKAAPKVLSVSSTVEVPTLEVEDPTLDVGREGMVEEMEFASQFAPPCGTERLYLDVEPGQPASPATGRGEESEGDRTLKAAKSAARRLLEDLVGEQERLDALEPPAASHMPFSVLEGARLGFLDPQQVQEFTQRANVAKNMAMAKPSAPPKAPPPPVPAQAPMYLPPPPRVPTQMQRDRFQPYPPMWTMPCPAPMVVARPTKKPAPTMANWIARDAAPKLVPTAAPKVFSTMVPTVVPTTTPPPSPTVVPTTAPPPSPTVAPTTAPPPSPTVAPTKHRRLRQRWLQRRHRHLLRRRHRCVLQRRRRCLLQQRCQSLRHR